MAPTGRIHSEKGITMKWFLSNDLAFLPETFRLHKKLIV
jgi:hypothetical protein